LNLRSKTEAWSAGIFNTSATSLVNVSWSAFRSAGDKHAYSGCLACLRLLLDDDDATELTDPAEEDTMAKDLLRMGVESEEEDEGRRAAEEGGGGASFISSSSTSSSSPLLYLYSSSAMVGEGMGAEAGGLLFDVRNRLFCAPGNSYPASLTLSLGTAAVPQVTCQKPLKSV